MKIAVCIKQVPDTTSVRIDPQTNTLIREGVESIINPFDRYAIEEGVLLKEQHTAETYVVTMGPPQAEKALRDALALGIDHAVHLTDRAFAGSDTLATSRVLASAIRKLDGIDLVICGKQASDGDTAQVGPGIAVFLDIPEITYVKKIHALDLQKKTIEVERLTEDGYEVLKSPMPCVITVVKEINTPRLPSFKGLLRAKKAPIQSWSCKDLGLTDESVGLKGSPTAVVKIFNPPSRTGGTVLPDDSEENIGALFTSLEKLV